MYQIIIHKIETLDSKFFILNKFSSTKRTQCITEGEVCEKFMAFIHYF
jgi:hypothetical protein